MKMSFICRGYLLIFAALIFLIVFILCSCTEKSQIPPSEDIQASVSPTANPETNLGDTQTVLKVGKMGDSLYLDELIEAFTNDNPNVSVIVTDYLETGANDPVAGIKFMKDDINGGYGPDLFCISPAFAPELVKIGALQDLYPYIDADLTLSRDDFMGSILRGAENDGCLYSIAPLFYILTARGQADKVGSEKHLSYDKLRATLGEMPEGSSAFTQDITREIFLMYLYQVSGNSFYNKASGKSYFTSESFINSLEFAKSLPKDGGGDNPVLEITRISSLHAARASSPDTTYTGLPTDSSMKPGSAIVFATGELAISNTCENFALAWSFVRRFFEEETQMEMARRNFITQASLLPTNKAALSRMAESTLSPNGDFYVEGQDELTREDLDHLLETIEDVETVSRNNQGFIDNEYSDPIVDIILEETIPFFSGNISAQDAALQIDQKVAEYMLQFS